MGAGGSELSSGGYGAPSDEVTRRTMRLELRRAVAWGVIETAGQTFAVLIAVRHFETATWVKSILVGSFHAGLLASIFVVPFLHLLHRPPARLASVITAISGMGFLVAAVFPDSVATYVSGMCVGFFFISLQTPLLTQMYRENYPDHVRGRLFSVTMIVRAGAAIAFSQAAGWMLGVRMGWFPVVVGAFALAAFYGAYCLRRVPVAGEMGRREVKVWDGFRWVKRDGRFRLVLLSLMFMGIAIHMSLAVAVEYLANPRHGLAFTAPQVALLTTALPAAFRLATTFFWGTLFDRMNFFVLRAVLNVFFVAGMLFFFLGESIWVIGVGAALNGVARGRRRNRLDFMGDQARAGQPGGGVYVGAHLFDGVPRNRGAVPGIHVD